jgi:threonyl-tRNA synthetase
MDLHDHRLLGPRLELFHQQEDAPGTVFLASARCRALWAHRRLEHYRGALPFWLAPEQIVVSPVPAEQQQYACDVADTFTAAGLRCVNEDARETLARRIAAAHERSIPIIAIAGATEAAAAGSISLRERGGRRSPVDLAQAVHQLAAQAAR